MDVGSKDIRRAAMDMLARREQAKSELLAKLGQRFDGQDELIEAEVDRLAAEGLQSDGRLAESLIRARAGRGQGPLKIRAELKGKGVPGDVIDLAFEQCDTDWFELAAAVCRKRFGESAPADVKEKAKRSRFLQQRGFSFDHISSVL